MAPQASFNVAHRGLMDQAICISLMLTLLTYNLNQFQVGSGATASDPQLPPLLAANPQQPPQPNTQTIKSINSQAPLDEAQVSATQRLFASDKPSYPQTIRSAGNAKRFLARGLYDPGDLTMHRPPETARLLVHQPTDQSRLTAVALQPRSTSTDELEGQVRLNAANSQPHQYSTAAMQPEHGLLRLRSSPLSDGGKPSADVKTYGFLHKPSALISAPARRLSDHR